MVALRSRRFAARSARAANSSSASARSPNGPSVCVPPSLAVSSKQASQIPLPRGAREPLVITVTAEGTYRVNERALINASPDTLRAALLKEAGSDRGPITIKADGRSTHQAVVTAMDVAGKLGFAQLNIATVHEDGSP